MLTPDQAELPAFDPASAVDPPSDSIDLGVDHGLKTGEAVTYRADGSPIDGLADGQMYFVIAIPGSPTRIALAATPEDALAGFRLPIDMPVASGTAHRLEFAVPTQAPAAITANSARTTLAVVAPTNAVAAATGSQAVAPTSGTTAAIDGRAGCNLATAVAECTIVTAATISVQARSRFVEDVITGGFGLAAVAVGVGVVVSTIEADVSAYVGPGTSLQGIGGAGALSVIAQLDETIKVIGAAGALGGVVAGGSAVAVILERSDVRALLGSRGDASGAIVNPTIANRAVQVGGAGFATVTVDAGDVRDIKLAVAQVSVTSLLGLGAGVTVVEATGRTEAQVGDSARIGSSAVPVGDVAISAHTQLTVGPFSASAPMGLSIGVGALGGAAGLTWVTVGGDASAALVRAGIGLGATVYAGAISVSATSTRTIDINVSAGAAGVASAGVVVAIAKVVGATRAIVEYGADLSGTSLTVSAIDGTTVKSVLVAVGVGFLGSGAGGRAEATVNVPVDARVGPDRFAVRRANSDIGDRARCGRHPGGRSPDSHDERCCRVRWARPRHQCRRDRLSGHGQYPRLRRPRDAPDSARSHGRDDEAERREPWPGDQDDPDGDGHLDRRLGRDAGRNRDAHDGAGHRVGRGVRRAPGDQSRWTRMMVVSP